MRVVFVGQQRSIARRLVLYFLTLGISRRRWLYDIHREVDGHEALAVRHPIYAFLLCLPVGGPLWVNFVVAHRTAAMMAGSPVRFGPWFWIALPTVVPIAGNVWYQSWVQSRLNRFWMHEKAQPHGGVEVDVDLPRDPAFLVELGRAVKASYHVGSRFDDRKQARKAKWAARRTHLDSVRAERKAVREAGGSTPLLPFRRPQRPAVRNLKVTCGRCQTAFSVLRDPTAETSLVCPKCGLAEVLPALASNPLLPEQPAAVPTLKVKCPKCATEFRAVHNLRGPTTLTCPNCGRTDSVPPPRAAPG